MAQPRVFISCGNDYLPQYTEFRTELERFLIREGVDARIIGVNEHPAGNPLPHILRTIKSCHGVLVVAFARRKITSGVEKPGSPDQIALDGRSFTTPWNHVEAAIAYSLGIPLYIVCENGLCEEALIESKIDWYVQRMALTKDALWSAPVKDSLSAWIEERVKEKARKPRYFRTIEGSLKLSEMTPREIWGVIAVIAAVFAAGLAAGRFIPPLG
jgi:hypothetical protein